MALTDALSPPNGEAKIIKFSSSDQTRGRLELQAHIDGREYKFVLPLCTFFDFALSDAGAEFRKAIRVEI